jgi:hypothetical protein
MALVDPSIAMSFRGLQLPPPTNALAQYAQLMQIQQAQRQGEVSQMQLDKLRRDKDIFDQFQANVIKHGGPSDPNATIQAFLSSPNPEHVKIGYEMRLKKEGRDQYNAYLARRGLLPSGAPATAAPAAAPAEAFTAAPEAPAIPGVVSTPVAPRVMPQANVLAPMTGAAPTIDLRAQADIEGIQREIDRLPAAEKQAGSDRLMILQAELAKAQARAGAPNALAPAPTPSINALTTTAPPPQLDAQAIQQEMEFLSGIDDPRAKARIEILKPQLVEALKVTTGAPGSTILRGGRVVGQVPRAPTKLQEEFEFYQKAGGTKNIDEFVSSGAQSELSKLGDKAYIERSGKLRDNAEAATVNVGKLNKVITHLRSSDAITGIGAELFNDLNRARTKFLADKEAGKKVTDTEYLKALLSSDVFPMIQSLGIGARGMDTPAEKNFLLEVMTGKIELNRDTLIKMTTDRFDNEVRAIDKYNKSVDKKELDDYFRVMRIQKEKIPVPTMAEIKPASVNKTLEGIFGRRPGGQ